MTGAVTSVMPPGISEPVGSTQPRCGEEAHQDRSHPAAPVHFLNTEAVLARFRPIGRSRASKIIQKDPRFPRPLLGGRPGSKAIYSRQAVDAYFDLAAREGFPHLN